MELHPKQGPTQAPGFPFSDGRPALVPVLVRQALSRLCRLPSPVPSCIFFNKYFCHLNILVLSFVSFDMILLLLLFIIFVSIYLLKIRLGLHGYPPKSFSCGNELGAFQWTVAFHWLSENLVLGVWVLNIHSELSELNRIFDSQNWFIIFFCIIKDEFIKPQRLF